MAIFHNAHVKWISSFDEHGHLLLPKTVVFFIEGWNFDTSDFLRTHIEYIRILNFKK